MSAILELPKSSKTDPKGQVDLLEALDVLLDPAISERNQHQVNWWIVDAYLQGCREFDVIDAESGTVDTSYELSDASVQVRWDEPLSRLTAEVGRLSRLDTKPLSKKRSRSLESMRNSALSQALLDNIAGSSNEDVRKIALLYGICIYGTYGQASWPDYASKSPLAHIHENIPPWELLGLPAGTMCHDQESGLSRTRLFPLSQLEKMPGFRMPRNYGLLDVVDLPYGAEVSHINPSSVGSIGSTGSYMQMFDERSTKSGVSERRKKQLSSQPRRDVVQFVRLREVFLNGPEGSVSRYIARAGDWIGSDVNYWSMGKMVPMPIGITRYDDVGRFYGRSFMSKVIPLAVELEALLGSIIKNMEEYDTLGIVLLPAEYGIDTDALKASTKEPRIASYQSDPSVPKGAIEHLVPTTANDVPGRVLNFGVQLLDRIVSQGPLTGSQYPRADSGASFRVLDEIGAMQLLPIAIGIEASYVTRYRSMLHNVRARFARSSTEAYQGIEITRITNSIAGVTLDPVTGKLQIRAEQLPDPYSVDLSIVSRDPAHGDRRRVEAIDMLNAGRLTPLDFIVMNYENGWDFPIGNKAVWENYVKAVLWNLIMFNDGIVPGEPPDRAFFDPICDIPEVHMMAVEDFISGPEFALASPAVHEAFRIRVTDLKGRLGMLVPDQLPTIDQAAALSLQQRARGSQAAA